MSDRYLINQRKLRLGGLVGGDLVYVDNFKTEKVLRKLKHNSFYKNVFHTRSSTPLPPLVCGGGCV